jgi:hypothetical protein
MPASKNASPEDRSRQRWLVCCRAWPEPAKQNIFHHTNASRGRMNECVGLHTDTRTHGHTDTHIYLPSRQLRRGTGGQRAMIAQITLLTHHVIIGRTKQSTLRPTSIPTRTPTHERHTHTHTHAHTYSSTLAPNNCMKNDHSARTVERNTPTGTVG